MNAEETRPTPSLRRHDLERSRQATMTALMGVNDATLHQLSRLTLPEIRAIQQEIAQVLPAGNLPAFVLSGLLKLKGRRLDPDRVQQDIVALLRGVSLLPQGLYGMFIAGPAAVLYVYQKLLLLAGKDAASAFPQGTWQFYLQFGVREDAARHVNETAGFHRMLPPQPDPVAMAGAWVCAAAQLLYGYDELLAVDWSERVMLRSLIEEAVEAGLADQPVFVDVTAAWSQRRPYHRPGNGVDYLAYRQAIFHDFLQERMSALPPQSQERFRQRYQAHLPQELSAYQEQMTILAALRPDRYREHKEPVPLWQASIGFVWQGQTYLLPACQRDEAGAPLCYPPPPDEQPPFPLRVQPGGMLCDAAGYPLWVDRGGQVHYRQGGQRLGSLRPPAPTTVQGWLSAILNTCAPELPSTLDLLLAGSPRALQPELREKLPPDTQAALAALRCAPVIVNWDPRPHELPLAVLRRGQRGIGDHALTIFRTDRSAVFDQSHVFFDGMWGMAVAEILTDSASHWYRSLSSRPLSFRLPAPRPLRLAHSLAIEALARSRPLRSEAAAESIGVDVARLHWLRQWLRQRGVRLTVNDLLLLYRFFHAAEYQPSPTARQALEAFRARAVTSETRAALQAVEATLARFRETNPAILIPMDASNVSPRERVFPTTFRNPLVDVRQHFDLACEGRAAYQAQPSPQHWSTFDQARRDLLAYLKAFGGLLDALKAVTMRGESFNTASIRLLAHLPDSMQYLLDQIPQRIGILNEIVKGNEAFSNVGCVAPGTSLTRFTSAKDDGETKELVWGVLTDAQGCMHISLRDFRPYVPLLLALGEARLANQLAQDYLSGYVQGFNNFVAELSAIVTLKY